jgi:hypothetical protein
VNNKKKHHQQQMLARNPHPLLVQCKLIQPLWKTVWRLLKNLKMELPYDPAISLLQIYPKECESGYKRDTRTPMFIVALFTIAKLGK